MSDRADAAVPIERGGRKGRQLPDGAILWDDGEKEVPTSGLTDEQKRAMARAAADGQRLETTKEGVSADEIRALEGIGRLIADPHKLLELRKANAKANAGKPPAQRRPEQEMASFAELQSNYRGQAKTLLEREIDRLEELKTLAIAGHVTVYQDNAPMIGRNPPMAVHELVLETIRVSDSGNPAQLLAQLRKTGRITGDGAPRVDELPYPPPDGYPPAGTTPLPPEAASNPGLNRASDAVQSGGQPTVFPAPNDPNAPPPVDSGATGTAARKKAPGR